MPITLKPGYTRRVVATNIASLERDGAPRPTAIRLAFDHARATFFRKYPEGALPVELAYPKTHRLAKYYTGGGSPIRRNPVGELPIPPQEMDEIRREVQKSLSGRGADVRRAARLYTDFTGHDDVQVDRVAIPGAPKVALAIGQVDGIMYTTVRDGETEKYIHKFAKRSRPLLTATPDGKQLYLIGGSYNFTDRGIVDKTPRK